MINPLDYWHSIKRYKPRQLLYRLKYLLEKEKIINKSYLYNYKCKNNYKNQINMKSLHIGNDKIKQIKKTILDIENEQIFMFNNYYNLKEILIHKDIGLNSEHKLKSYELSYFQFCHDLSFAIANNLIDNNKLNKSVQLIIFVITKSRDLTNKHPFWYPYSVSSRLINLSLFYNNILSCDVVSENDKSNLYNHISLELDYLTAHLEFDCDGNHLLKNYLALFIGNGLLGNKTKAGEYLKLLLLIAQDQILESGLHYEKSIDYHMLVMHDIFIANLVMDKLSLGKRKTMSILLNKMLSCAEILLTENEKPLFHDTFEPSYFSHKELLSIIKKYNKLNFNKNNNDENKIDCFRIYNKGSIKIIIDKSEVSPSFCPAHSHDACLHYELWYNGIKFITDSGNETYSISKERNYYRSSHAHNLSAPDDLTSQSILLKSFRFGRTAKLLNYTEDILEGTIYISSVVKGYYTKIRSRKLYRNFEIHSDKIVIKDMIKCNNAVSFIHFSPNTIVEEKIKGRSYLLSQKENKLQINLEGNIVNSKLIDTLYSDRFYSCQNKKTLKIIFNNNFQYQFSPIV